MAKKTATQAPNISAPAVTQEPAAASTSSPLSASGLTDVAKLIQDVNAIGDAVAVEPAATKTVIPVKPTVGKSDPAKVRARNSQGQFEAPEPPLSEVEPTDAFDIDDIESPEFEGSKAEAVADTFPLYLQQAAFNAGIDHNDFVSPEALTKYLLRTNQSGAPAPQNPHQAAPKVDAPAPFDPFDGVADKFDDETKSIIGKVVSHFEKKVAAAEQVAAHVQGTITDQGELAVDQAFNELNDEFGGVFGQGRARSMHPNHPTLQARQTIFGLASAWAQRTGEPFDSNLLRKIAAVQFPVAAVKKASTQEKVAARRSQHVAAPTARVNPTLSPRDEGEAYIQQFLASAPS